MKDNWAIGTSVVVSNLNMNIGSNHMKYCVINMFRNIEYLNICVCLTLIQCKAMIDRQQIKDKIEGYVNIGNLKFYII